MIYMQIKLLQLNSISNVHVVVAVAAAAVIHCSSSIVVVVIVVEVLAVIVVSTLNFYGDISDTSSTGRY